MLRATKSRGFLGGSGGMTPQNILKIRTPEMPFPAILALNSKLQYDLKKGQNFAILPYFSQKWQFDHQFEEALQNGKLRIQG
jgi:hypothetical protein